MYVGVDIGGTKVELCRFSSDYSLLSSQTVPTNSMSPGSDAFRLKLIEHIGQFIKPGDLRLGIATKGIVHQGVVLYSSLMGGEVRRPLQAEFEHAFRMQVVVDNDIRPLAVAERYMGRARDCANFVIVNLGTGLGIVSYDQSVRFGYGSTAGQVDRLYCWVDELQRMETVQNIISGAGISALYRELTGNVADGERIFELAQLKDESGQRVVRIFSSVLIKFLEDISYFYNPERIFFSGSLKHSLASLLPEILSRYEERVDIFSRPREIAISDLSHASCLGAVLNFERESCQ